MTSVRCSVGLLTLALLGVASCSGYEGTRPDLTGPVGASLRTSAAFRLPGAPARFVQCDSGPVLQGAADIGPRGGRIVAGDNRLVVPAGALTATVHITLTVPEDGRAFIALAPTGLVFLKQVRLVFSTGGCSLRPPPGSWTFTPYAVYVDDGGHVRERLPAFEDRLHQTVSTAILHFSGYGLAW